MSDHPQSDVSDALEARRREERRAVEEAGGGEAEGFELAEELLIEHASHGDQHTTSQIGQRAGRIDEAAAALDEGLHGEADSERHP